MAVYDVYDKCSGFIYVQGLSGIYALHRYSPVSNDNNAKNIG